MANGRQHLRKVRSPGNAENSDDSTQQTSTITENNFLHFKRIASSDQLPLCFANEDYILTYARKKCFCYNGNVCSMLQMNDYLCKILGGP